MSALPLIAHVLYRLDTGGMERVLVSVINRTRGHYRHAVICLAGFGALRDQIDDAAVECISLDKRPGKDPGWYFRLWRTLRRLQPDLVQTYNLGTLDAAPIARLAGVRRVVHAEHGRDAADPDGTNRKYKLLRWLLQPWITRFVAVSGDLATWLRDGVGIARGRVVCIPNGIDTARYAADPAAHAQRPLLGAMAPPGTALIISVGRLDAVKDQANLIRAFQLLCQAAPESGAPLYLVIAGEGAQRANLERQIAQGQLGDKVRLLGNRGDVAALLAEADVFALPSRAEGIPLTVLEAMAAGLPVVATRVGGVGEVVVDGKTGTLVPADDAAALAAALGRYLHVSGLARKHGDAGRTRVEARFGMAPMVAAYAALYDELLAVRRDVSPRSTALDLPGQGRR